jgi:thiol-disulfide isomerase/thioredoxin
MRRVVLIVVAIAVVVGLYELARHNSARSGKGGPPGAVGSVAPGFSVQDIDGKPLDFANYSGKVVLLDFWATWCVPCRTEIPHFIEFQNNYAAQGFQVVGISMDDGPQPVREFYKQFNMNYPVGMGTTKLAESYGGILGLPVTFLIGRNGHVAAKYVGLTDTGTIQQKIEALLQKK